MVSLERREFGVGQVWWVRIDGVLLLYCQLMRDCSARVSLRGISVDYASAQLRYWKLH